MKTLFVRLKSLFGICLLLCFACNDDIDETNGHSPFSSTLGIKIAVLDQGQVRCMELTLFRHIP